MRSLEWGTSVCMYMLMHKTFVSAQIASSVVKIHFAPDVYVFMCVFVCVCVCVCVFAYTCLFVQADK